MLVMAILKSPLVASESPHVYRFGFGALLSVGASRMEPTKPGLPGFNPC